VGQSFQAAAGLWPGVKLHRQPGFCGVELSPSVQFHAALRRGGSLKGLPHVFDAHSFKVLELCETIFRGAVTF